MDVRLVPMFVPITTGIPLKSVTIVKLFICNIIRNYGQYQDTLKDTCSTVIVSEATMATTREVVAEEDCSRDVAKMPMASLDVDSDDNDGDDGGHDGDVVDGGDDVEVIIIVMVFGVSYLYFYEKDRKNIEFSSEILY